MKRIGVISDTHGHLPQQIYTFFHDCDEIWHAGDIGPGVAQELSAFKPLRAVWGNIDHHNLHYLYPKVSIFELEGQKVVMTHIGGYRRHYAPQIKQLLQQERPQIFVSGHSHILKVMYDHDLQLLHINPGAAGRQGFQKVDTLVRFTLDPHPKDLEILEFPK